MKHSAISRTTYRNYWLGALLFSSIGLLASFYSCYSHYQIYTNLTYSSFCALSQAINCDTVAQSPWSIFLGLPMAWWGIISFSSYLILLSISIRQSPDNLECWTLLFLLGCMYSFLSLLLGLVSVTQIHSICIVCLVVYTCHLGTTYISWLIQRRLSTSGVMSGIGDSYRCFTKNNKVTTSFLALMLTVILLKLFLPSYWLFSLTTTESTIAHGLTSDGHPWIGAEQPKLTIEEFSDYQCFQCAKMHYFLRKLITEYPDKIRLIHRNFPLDHEVNSVVTPEPFHIGSGKMAMLAIYASSKGKFWEMNDALYDLVRKKNKKIYLPDLAQKTGLKKEALAWAIQSKEVNTLLSRDIWRGMKHGITGTPGFIIKGKLYLGTIPPNVLSQVIK